jgi:hypothetical protein
MVSVQKASDVFEDQALTLPAFRLLKSMSQNPVRHSGKRKTL